MVTKEAEAIVGLGDLSRLRLENYGTLDLAPPRTP
jgi:hypothetical protein